MFWLAYLDHAPLGCQWRGLVWLSTCPNERSQLIRQTSNKQSYDGVVDAPRPVSLISRFHNDMGDAARCEVQTRHHTKKAEHLSQFIRERVITLLLMGKAKEANSLLEEFDQPQLWDDPLD